MWQKPIALVPLAFLSFCRTPRIQPFMSHTLSHFLPQPAAPHSLFHFLTLRDDRSKCNPVPSSQTDCLVRTHCVDSSLFRLFLAHKQKETAPKSPAVPFVPKYVGHPR